MYRETYQPFMFVDTLEEMGFGSGAVNTVRAEVGTRAICLEDEMIYVKTLSVWELEGGSIKPPSPWTPAPGAEIPPIGDTGDQHIIAGLSSPFTTTVPGPNGEPPIGTVLDNGDRLVQNAGGGFDVIPAPKISPKVPEYGTAGVDYKADTLVKAGGVLYVVTQDFTDSGKTLAQEITAGNISELHPAIQSVTNATTATGDKLMKDNIIVDLSTGTSYIVLVDSAADTITNLLTASKIAPMGGLSDVAVWVTATDYAKDSIVVDNTKGGLYRVLTDPYTSGATIDADVTANKLEQITSSGINTWVSGDEYKVDTIIVDSLTHIPYMALKDFTAGVDVAADILALNMELVSKPTKTEPWAPNTAYTAGSMVYGTNGEGLFIVVADYTSGVTNITDDVTNGDLVAAVVVPKEVFAVADNVTTVGEIIPIDAIIVNKATGESYQVLAITTALDTIDTLLTANKLTMLSAPEKGGIVYDPTKPYEVGDIVSVSGKIFVCTLAVAIPEPFNRQRWTSSTEPVTWTTSTTYKSGEIINDGNNVLYVVVHDYPSGATIEADITAGHIVAVANQIVFVADDITVVGKTPVLRIVLDESSGMFYRVDVPLSVTDTITTALAAVPPKLLHLGGDGPTSKSEMLTAPITSYDVGVPVSDGALIFVNGSLLRDAEYTIAGNIVTIPGGVNAAMEIKVINGIVKI